MAKKILLGESDLEVSRIAAGCWQLSPQFWGEVDPAEWKQALYEAPEMGINFIDTANAYGEGFAEESLGAFFKESGMRDQFVVATKFFWDFRSENRYPNTAADAIRRECENSLRRLRIDCIDLYQLHAWDPLLRPEEVARVIEDLKMEGKIRWFGVSNLIPEQLRLVMGYTQVVSLQSKFSVLSPGVMKEDLPFCMANRLGFLAYSPLEMGLLSGKYNAGNLPGDPRAGNQVFSPENLERVGQKITKLKELAKEEKLSLAEFALRWVLTHPSQAIALAGFKNAGHLKSAMKAAEAPLETRLWHAAHRLP